jgi:hypothetical protein
MGDRDVGAEAAHEEDRPGVAEEAGEGTAAEAWVRGVLGTLLDDLVFAMRDHLAPPLTLPPGEHVASRAPRLAAAYVACASRLDERLTGNPADVAEVRGLLPWHLADPKDEHLISTLLEAATFMAFYAFDKAVFAAKDATARLYTAHPDLLDATDGDGLLRLAGHEVTPQVLFHHDSAIPYHRFLRRNFAGHVNDTLTQTLLQASDGGAATLRLALDEQHFMARSAFTPYFEHDYWYGPPLSAAVLDDPYKVGTTVHADPRSGLMHEYPRLYVHWAMDKEGRKVVQIEELSDDSGSNQGGYRLLRYLHAIRDIERSTFIHCDGAVRAYTPEQYDRRCSKEFVTGRESAARYRKVFRLDGAIGTNAWSNIAAGWFRGNTLMTEYLQTLSSAVEAQGT